MRCFLLAEFGLGSRLGLQWLSRLFVSRVYSLFSLQGLEVPTPCNPSLRILVQAQRLRRLAPGSPDECEQHENSKNHLSSGLQVYKWVECVTVGEGPGEFGKLTQ